MLDDRELAKRCVALARRLREIRAGQGMSQEDVADQADISRGHYGSIERAKANPSIKHLWSIADVLGVHVTELLSDSRGRSGNAN